MNPLIESHRSELEQFCKRFRVKRLDLFGSAATGDFKSETSDLDFLVEFQPLRPNERVDAYFGLLFALEDLFQYKIDLVESEAVQNPYFLRSANQSRTLLYAA